MSECKGCSFEVGDKVRVEFEGVVDNDSDLAGRIEVDIPNDILNISRSFMPYFNPKNLTLIEPAKPGLEVEQVWRSNGGYDRTIRIIESGRVCYWNHKIKNFNDCSIEIFLEDYAHKLLEENKK